LCHTDHIAIPINKYNAVHTGAKTQSGGVKNDLDKDEYHGSLEDIVATLPMNEAKYVVAKKITKDKNLFFNIIIYISCDHE